MSALVQSVRINLEETKYTALQKMYYYAHFLTKSFLLAIMTIFIFIFAFLTFYFGDLMYNVKNGNYKSPLLSAYVIASPSMVPTIKVNDAVIIKRVNNDDLQVGDIITFANEELNVNGYTITHRIVGKEKSSNGEYVYYTKGDNNNSEDDGIVKREDIYGKVILKIPKIGFVQNFITKPKGFLISILVPVVLILLYELVRILIVLPKKKYSV